jgi:multidrug transporter EmrE-like cation transporter
MIFILLAALFSVTVSVTLKYFKLKNLDILQILAFNYLSASMIALVYYQPNFARLNLQSNWWLIVLMGVLLPSVFWCLNRALDHAGLMRTEIAQRISVVLTLSVSALYYQETLVMSKIAGIVLGVVAVLLMLWDKSQAQRPTKSAVLSLLAVWCGYALIDLLFKYTATLGLHFPATLSAIFMCAALLMLLLNQLRAAPWQRHNMLAGLFLGGLNFANIALYLSAHQHFSQHPSVVFAAMNICVVVLGMLAALWLFKEKATASKLCGAACAVVAVLLLMQSMP